MSRPRVVLNMIVKDEAPIIRQCFDSVLPYIDAYCIVDTGSTDDTIDVIRGYFGDKGIPGVVHERPWVNFGHNRSEALAFAREVGDYAFVMDADDLVHGKPDLSQLEADSYMVQIRSGEIVYWRHQIFSSRREWRYEGVVHEYATCGAADALSMRMKDDWYIESRRLGARNAPTDKYRRDANLLLDYLADHPDDSRSVFYLAQSYFDLGELESALSAYARRANMGGWEEEVYYSKYRVGMCLIGLGRPRGEILDAMLGAWEYRPARAEPLYQLAKWHRERNLFRQAAMFARTGVSIPRPVGDILFVTEDVYTWRLKDEFAVSAYYIGDFGGSLQYCADLIHSRVVPTEHQGRIQRNLELATQALSPGAPEIGK